MISLWAVFAVFYLTKILRYDNDKTSHFGPMRDDTQSVYNPQTKQSQPVTLFDYIRRYSLFNPYSTVASGIWMVDVKKIERWSCPTCLSFWVTFLVTVPLFVGYLTTGKDILTTLLEIILFHYFVAGCVSMLFSVLFFLEKPE